MTISAELLYSMTPISIWKSICKHLVETAGLLSSKQCFVVPHLTFADERESIPLVDHFNRSGTEFGNIRLRINKKIELERIQKTT